MAKQVEEIGKSVLPTMLYDDEFCNKLDEMWRFSNATYRECGVVAYLGQDGISLSDTIEGDVGEMTLHAGKMIVDGLSERKGVSYFFAHTHPNLDGRTSHLPSPADLEFLWDMRLGLYNFGIGMRPIHAVIRHGRYKDESSLDMVLYQEKTNSPASKNKNIMGRAKKTLIVIHDLPEKTPSKYEVAPEEFIDTLGYLSDSSRVKMLANTPFFNAEMITYYKDMRIKNGVPYTYFSPSRLDVFAHSLEFNPEVLKSLK